MAEVENAPDLFSRDFLLKNYEATFVPVKASYVKIIVTNTGKDNWVLMNEIKVE